MRSLRTSLPAIAVATGLVALAACSASTPEREDRSGTTSSAVRTVTQVPGTPACPGDTILLCRINFGLQDGGPPRESDQCSPLISVTPLGGGTSFLWFSSGQLVDAVVVSASANANVYEYRPPISRDTELLFAPSEDGGGRLHRIDFCVKPDAGVDAGADVTADAPEDAADAAEDARGPKAW